MTALLIFGGGFIVVYLLGLQSLNVNGGHYGPAFATSFGIGLSNLLLYKTVPHADVVQMSAYVLSGPFAIVAAMATHAWFKRRRRAREILSIHDWSAREQAAHAHKAAHTDHPVRHYDRTCPACNAIPVERTEGRRAANIDCGEAQAPPSPPRDIGGITHHR